MLDASGDTHSVSVYTTVNVVTLVALENSQAGQMHGPHGSL